MITNYQDIQNQIDIVIEQTKNAFNIIQEYDKLHYLNQSLDYKCYFRILHEFWKQENKNYKDYMDIKEIHESFLNLSNNQIIINSSYQIISNEEHKQLWINYLSLHTSLCLKIQMYISLINMNFV